jgi:hypothetical protein
LVYVSITGLKLKSVRHAPRFWWHAIRSMKQAQLADGNISASAQTINGVHHTLSVWQSERHMRDYLETGAHLQAMRKFRSMATGKTIGFESDAPPKWEDVHDIWTTRGRKV